jgi:hypothetical protein
MLANAMQRFNTAYIRKHPVEQHKLRPFILNPLSHRDADIHVGVPEYSENEHKGEGILLLTTALVLC